MEKTKLQEIIKKSLEIQGKLFARLDQESDIKSREWTAMQIVYQKRVYKTAVHGLGGGYTINGIECVDITELNIYYNQLCA